MGCLEVPCPGQRTGIKSTIPVVLHVILWVQLRVRLVDCMQGSSIPLLTNPVDLACAARIRSPVYRYCNMPPVACSDLEPKQPSAIPVEQMVIQNVFLAVRSHVHCLFGFSAYIGTNDHICNLATP